MDAQQLGEMLAGGPLGGRPVFTIELPRSSEVVFTVPVQVKGLDAEWRAARSLVSDTGRWPVAACAWDPIPACVSARTFWLDPRGEKPPPPELRRRAAGMTGPQAIGEIRAAEHRGRGELFEMIDWHLQATLKRCGQLPDRDLLVNALAAANGQLGSINADAGMTPLATETALEHWLFEWEEQLVPSRAPERADYDDWFVPADDQCHLLFLPTCKGAEALAYLEFYAENGVPGASTERLIAILDSWETRFGAELVAHWDTMLQFVVDRPPASLAAAWELATEQHLVAPCTNALPGQTVRDFARMLWRRPTWFMHERP